MVSLLNEPFRIIQYVEKFQLCFSSSETKKTFLWKVPRFALELTLRHSTELQLFDFMSATSPVYWQISNQLYRCSLSLVSQHWDPVLVGSVEAISLCVIDSTANKVIRILYQFKILHP